MSKHPLKKFKSWREYRSWDEPSKIIDVLRERSIRTKRGCFEWRGYCVNNGYGVVTIESAPYMVHRVAAALFLGWKWAKKRGGPTTKYRLQVCHSCDNPPCWNPDHLFKGRPKANIQDSVRKGRHPGAVYGSRLACSRGHAYTKENTLWKRNGKHRVCRTCMRDHSYLRDHPEGIVPGAKRRGPYVRKGRAARRTSNGI